jgi:hypothetical protein
MLEAFKLNRPLSVPAASIGCQWSRLFSLGFAESLPTGPERDGSRRIIPLPDRDQRLRAPAFVGRAACARRPTFSGEIANLPSSQLEYSAGIRPVLHAIR